MYEQYKTAILSLLFYARILSNHNLRVTHILDRVNALESKYEALNKYPIKLEASKHEEAELLEFIRPLGVIENKAA